MKTKTIKIKTLHEALKEHILNVLLKNNHCIMTTAQILDITIKELYARLHEYGYDFHDPKRPKQKF